MSDKIKIEYNIKTDIHGSDCSDVLEFDRKEWEAMSESEREEIMRDAAFERVEWDYRETE